METKRLTVPVSVKLGSEPGSVEAAFSIFNMVDSTGDVVLPSFFTDGQPVPMAAWGHDWGSLPPGKGVIRVEADRAVFEGQFNLDTEVGREHYNTVKFLGDLQEWSFGFRIEKSEPGDFEGRRVRFLQRGETFEVSPVLIGANRETMTLAIKSAHFGDPETKDDPDHETKGLAQPGSYELRIDAVTDALNTSFINRESDIYAFPVSTHSDHVDAGVYTWESDEPLWYRVNYSIDTDGTITLGDATRLELGLTPAGVKGRQLMDALGRLLADSAQVKSRVSALAALRAKEGRAISTARRDQLGAWSGSLREIAGGIDALLEETAPKSAGATGTVLRLRSEFERMQARIARELGATA